MATAKKTHLKTELGLKIQTLKSHIDAEAIAALKEQVEDRQEKIKKHLEDLFYQMHEDKLSALKVQAPGGTVYRFETISTEKIKVTKPTS